jgi:hypothetical protein
MLKLKKKTSAFSAKMLRTLILQAVPQYKYIHGRLKARCARGSGCSVFLITEPMTSDAEQVFSQVGKLADTRNVILDKVSQHLASHGGQFVKASGVFQYEDGEIFHFEYTDTPT